jgi:hypothetical protein
VKIVDGGIIILISKEKPELRFCPLLFSFVTLATTDKTVQYVTTQKNTIGIFTALENLRSENSYFIGSAG